MVLLPGEKAEKEETEVVSDVDCGSDLEKKGKKAFSVFVLVHDFLY